MIGQSLWTLHYPILSLPLEINRLPGLNDDHQNDDKTTDGIAANPIQ
jgi:hypothetical protein